MRLLKFKKYMESENKTKVEKWLSDIKYFSLREAKETRIANNILIKIIKNGVGFSKEKPTEEELKFLKLHSKDLVKILGFIATTPTPIPYILISLSLKKFGLDLFPSKDDLDIPENHKKSNIK
jgi:hypothetical protein